MGEAENMLRTLEGMPLPDRLREELEALERDAQKHFDRYWGCHGTVGCRECPAAVDGKVPAERYGTVLCLHAHALEVVCRSLKLGMKIAQWDLERSLDRATRDALDALLYTVPPFGPPVGFCGAKGEEKKPPLVTGNSHRPLDALYHPAYVGVDLSPCEDRKGGA